MRKSLKNWATLSQETIFSAPPYVEVVKQKVDISGGGDSDGADGEGAKIIDDFYQVHLRPFAAIVPVLENGEVMTIAQYKHGLGRVSLTFPAGFVDPGEPPEQACHRELREETGLEVGRLVHLGEFVDNGNQRGCVGNFYLGVSCRQVSEPDAGDLEDMMLNPMSPEAIDLALINGDIGLTHHAAVWALARMRWLQEVES